MTTRSEAEDASFLAAFHAGERWAVEECYRAHVAKVLASARAVVGPVDAETVTHEVFYRLLAHREMRERFKGGNLGAWLGQVVTHSAIDDLRRRRRELGLDAAPRSFGDAEAAAPPEADLDAKRVVSRFRAERLPPEWAAVFEARFLRQLSQRDAARELGVPRSTLAYQEQRIRALLTRFVLDEDNEGDES